MGQKWNGLKCMVLFMIVAVVLTGCTEWEQQYDPNDHQSQMIKWMVEDPGGVNRPENVSRKDWP